MHSLHMYPLSIFRKRNQDDRYEAVTFLTGAGKRNKNQLSDLSTAFCIGRVSS